MELADKLHTASKCFRAWDALTGVYDAYEGISQVQETALDVLAAGRQIQKALQPSPFEIMLERAMNR